MLTNSLMPFAFERGKNMAGVAHELVGGAGLTQPSTLCTFSR